MPANHRFGLQRIHAAEKRLAGAGHSLLVSDDGVANAICWQAMSVREWRTQPLSPAAAA